MFNVEVGDRRRDSCGDVYMRVLYTITFRCFESCKDKHWKDGTYQN